jgi:hypothetical protein
MKVDAIFNIKGRGKVITGITLWGDNVFHTLGQTLTCGDRAWRVVAVDKFHRECFGMLLPTDMRYHGLQLEPIDHDEMPNIGDELI